MLQATSRLSCWLSFSLLFLAPAAVSLPAAETSRSLDCVCCAPPASSPPFCMICFCRKLQLLQSFNLHAPAAFTACLLPLGHDRPEQLLSEIWCFLIFFFSFSFFSFQTCSSHPPLSSPITLPCPSRPLLFPRTSIFPFPTDLLLLFSLVRRHLSLSFVAFIHTRAVPSLSRLHRFSSFFVLCFASSMCYE